MRKTIICTWIYSLFGIIVFLSLEYIFHLPPCALCKMQRIPYYIAFFVIGLLIKRLPDWMISLFFILLFAVALYISIFHFLVEEGKVFYSCISNINSLTIEDIRLSIKYAPPSCTEKSYFMGIRITILSMMVNFIIFALNGYNLIKFFTKVKKGKVS